MSRVVWGVLAWMFSAALGPSTAPIPETLHYIPFNFQNDTRQLKTAAELQTECAVWEAMVQQGSYGTHQLTCHVWPYVTIPYDKPTNPDGSQCTTAMGFAAGTAARAAGHAIGTESATNYLFYRAPMDNNGGDVCSHRNAWTGLYGVTLFQYAEAELWLSTVKGLHCCQWTEPFSNAAGNAFVTFRDAPNPSVRLSTDQRNYFSWHGQGHGSWNATERLSLGYLTTANFYSVTGAPPAGQSQTYTIVPMDDGLTDTTSKRAIIFNDLGFTVEARLKPESIDWNGGLNAFDNQTGSLLDMPPMPPWNNGVIPGMTSVNWALPVGGSYVDPTNQERITLVSLTASAAVVKLDHAGDGAQCVPTPEGVVSSTVTEASCAVWTLGAPSTIYANNFALLRSGVDTGGIAAMYLVCSGTVYTKPVPPGDAVWFRWSGTSWQRGDAQPPCGAPPPPVTWHDVTTGPVRVQQSSSDPTKYRACSVDLSKCTEFVWQ